MRNRNFALILLLITITFGTSGTTYNNEPYSPCSIKKDTVYSEPSGKDSFILYFFNSENNLLYFTEVKTLTDNTVKQKKTLIYGRFMTEGNTIKIQKDIDKTVQYKGRYTSSILFMFIPVRLSKGKDITVVDKEIITEGKIYNDSIIFTDTYFGTKNYNFKRKFLSKNNKIKSVLTIQPHFKAISIKNELYDTYTVTIVFDKKIKIK